VRESENREDRTFADVVFRAPGGEVDMHRRTIGSGQRGRARFATALLDQLRRRLEAQ
jgi:hypothetical protein